MRIVLVGASGMVGQGVLRACLAAKDVSEIILLARRPQPEVTDPRLRTVIVADLADFQASAAEFAAIDACFFCAGVSAFGMSEDEYRKITYDLTLHVATQLQQHSPQMTMVYVSGAGADSSEQSSNMWARVRGQTENALLQLGLPRVAILRPALIVPEDGIRSRTAGYRLFYTVLRPFLGPLRRLFPGSVLTTGVIGRAMLNAVRHGVPQALLAPRQINQLAEAHR